MATMWCQNIATRKQLGFGKVDSRKASESKLSSPRPPLDEELLGLMSSVQLE